MPRSFFSILAALAWTANPAAAQEVVADAVKYGVEPWTEAVVSVDGFEDATSLFRYAGGWYLTHSGAVERAELDYWNLPTNASARFERWCAPQTVTGCIRFVDFDGVKQRPIRPAARAWDTGGIFSVMVRSDDMAALYEQALDHGWWAESPPIRFSFGESDLRNVVLKGPHGINLAVYERIAPPFSAFPVGRISQAFNAMRMVRSRPVARDFYRDILGFDVLFDGMTEATEPTPSNFGIPLNFTPKITRGAAALQPVPGETGRVEVMQIEGFTGLDYSAGAVPPNLGIISVRYPVADLAGYKALLEARGAVISYAAKQVPVGGISTSDWFAVRDPDGNITEFYSHAD